MKFPEMFKAARRAGVPILAVETSDPQSSLAAMVSALNGKKDSVPMVAWDAVRAMRGLNPLGLTAVAHMCEGDPPEIKTASPWDALKVLAKLGDSGLAFMYGLPMFLRQELTRQAIWNLRDEFKARGCTVVLMGDSFSLPGELKDDVMVIGDPLPTLDELKGIAKSVIDDANVNGAGIKGADLDKIADVLTGLSAFAAEQQLAVSLEKGKVNMDTLWSRKVKTIEQTPGLSVWRGTETFADVGGCDNIKSFLRDIMTGNDKPKCIALVDEIEKMFAGVAGDTSGVSQDQLGMFLKYMQDRGTPGLIEIGPPGAAKTAVVKAAGKEFGVPVLNVDLGGTKSRYVGDSESNIRRVFEVVEAISQGKVLWIATCNSIAVLPPELRRRFYLGTFFFDLPNEKERAKIWDIYKSKYGLPNQTIPNDGGWTGAEIRACADKAWRMNCSLVKAAKTVVPVSVSAASQILRLQQECSGRYISANHEGLYLAPGNTPRMEMEAPGRKFTA